MENIDVGLKDIFSESLALKKLTGPALRDAIARHYHNLPDKEKRRISCAIAHRVITTLGSSCCTKKIKTTGQSVNLSNTKVLGINHTSLLDITIEWKTGPDGTLEPAGYRVDAGGDQINVSKVFSHFNRNIALIALTGRQGAPVTEELETNFLNEYIIPSFIRTTNEDTQVAVYNVVDGETLHGMFGWADELSLGTVEHINKEALSMLEKMFEREQDSIWVVFSAGGPVRHNSRLAYYSSLVKKLKEKYHDRIKLLIDFKFLSGPEEALSVLDIARETPQDIIKPNIEEFIQILVSSGLAAQGSLNKDTITEETVKKYAVKLRNKFNLQGVLVSMDKAGLLLVMKDRIIKEKGIKIKLASPTGSGDSLKAGVLYALSNGKTFEEAVHTGNLFGASTASMEGTQTVTPEVLAKTERLALEQNVVPVVEHL